MENSVENNELHSQAKIWEKLPIETLIQERERIAETLADAISRSQTIKLIISERTK